MGSLKNIEYDESGNILEQEYKNSAGKLINEPYYGIARIVYRYNEKSKSSERFTIIVRITNQIIFTGFLR